MEETAGDNPTQRKEKQRDPDSMKDCFGVCFGWFMEDLIGDEQQRRQCYACPDFEPCYQMTLIKSLTQLRFEIRRASQYVGRSIGGSHSAYPFG
jgi:hypothetical protein